MARGEATIPKWEAKLWSYLSSGDGDHCPLYGRCRARLRGGWCFAENGEKVHRFFDGDVPFDPDDYDFAINEYSKSDAIGRLVEQLAQKQLRKGGVRNPPVPTEVILLADEQYPIEIRQVPLTVYHGAIWRPKGQWIIQLKADDTPEVKRFTLFHEAFHILAHCRSTPVFRKRGATKGLFNELLADYFAVCLLMPREWVKAKWAEVRDLDRMAEIFCTPKPAIWFRLRELNLI